MAVRIAGCLQRTYWMLLAVLSFIRALDMRRISRHPCFGDMSYLAPHPNQIHIVFGRKQCCFIMRVYFLLTGLLILSQLSFGQGVGINTAGNDPDPSALLDISATPGSGAGILVPRISQDDRDAIESPADALIIFNTSSRCMEIYNAVPQLWETVHCLCNLPPGPGAQAATGVGATSFHANWQSVPGALGYILDVATDESFSSLILSEFNVGNVLTWQLTDLSCESGYFFRVRAISSCGIGAYSEPVGVTTGTCPFVCGSSLLVDPRDGKSYTTVWVEGSVTPYCGGSGQCWMAENLNFGTQIHPAETQTSGGDDNNTSVEKYCHGMVNGTDTQGDCEVYGGLYQWNEAMGHTGSVSGNGPGPQGVCPPGWHLPTDNEWKCLEMKLGLTLAQADATDWRGTDQGTRIKSTSGWEDDGNGNNNSGFNALPAGSRTQSSLGFANFGNYAGFWSSTQSSTTAGTFRNLLSAETGIRRANVAKTSAFSVRCVQD